MFVVSAKLFLSSRPPGGSAPGPPESVCGTGTDELRGCFSRLGREAPCIWVAPPARAPRASSRKRPSGFHGAAPTPRGPAFQRPIPFNIHWWYRTINRLSIACGVMPVA